MILLKKQVYLNEDNAGGIATIKQIFKDEKIAFLDFNEAQDEANVAYPSFDLTQEDVDKLKKLNVQIPEKIMQLLAQRSTIGGQMQQALQDTIAGLKAKDITLLKEIQ